MATEFRERQVAWSHALQSRGRDGGPTCWGRRRGSPSPPTSSTPSPRRRCARTGLAGAIRTNPYRSIVARAIELVDARRGARRSSRRTSRRRAPRRLAPGPAHAAWATEAPRGLIFHAYELDERGLIAQAQIVPPTSQNQAAIEADLAAFAPRVLDLPHDEATLRIEQLIRSYDPCISCATHFLDLSVETVP